MERFVNWVGAISAGQWLFLVALASLLLVALMILALLSSAKRQRRQEAAQREMLQAMDEKLRAEAEQARMEQAQGQEALAKVTAALEALASDLGRTQQGQIDAISGQIRASQAEEQGRWQTLSGALVQVSERLTAREDADAERFLQLRDSLQNGLQALGDAQGEALAALESSVQEKMQAMLQSRLDPSLEAVSGRLDQITEGLREITRIAGTAPIPTPTALPGVNGGAELGALLAQMLAPQQYAANVSLRPGEAPVADYVILMPGQGDGRSVMLPVDASLPMREFEELVKVSEGGVPEEIAQARGLLESAVRMHARRMSEKLIRPPYTTDYAILFLSSESLYAECLRISGLADCVQRESHMVLAGPTTFAALVSSLQIGFRSLAIEQQTARIEALLGAVRGEVERYAAALGRTQNRLRQAALEIETVQRHGDSIRKQLSDMPRLSEQAALEEGEEMLCEQDEWDE